MENYKERYGLGWKQIADVAQSREPFGGGSSKAAQEVPEDSGTAALSALQEALVFYSRPFLEILKSSPQKTARLFDVAEKINLKVDVAIPIEKYLLRHGYVTRMEESKVGNDVLMLTDAGETKLE